MIAIKIKFFGPTGSRGARIKATSDIGSVTIPYPHDLSGDDFDRAPLVAFLNKFPYVKKDGWGYGTIGEHEYWVNPNAVFDF